MERIAQASRLSPCLQQEASDTPKIGHIYGLGVIGSWGSTIEIEAAAFPATAPGKGSLRFNDTAGSMAKDSVSASAAVVRQLTDKRLSDYDLHINVIGGGNIDGPSAAAPSPAPSSRPLKRSLSVRTSPSPVRSRSPAR